jgi:hypothetical protein
MTIESLNDQLIDALRRTALFQRWRLGRPARVILEPGLWGWTAWRRGRRARKQYELDGGFEVAFLYRPASE